MKVININKVIKELKNKSFKEYIFRGNYIWLDDVIQIIKDNIQETPEKNTNYRTLYYDLLDRYATLQANDNN